MKTLLILALCALPCPLLAGEVDAQEKLAYRLRRANIAVADAEYQLQKGLAQARIDAQKQEDARKGTNAAERMQKERDECAARLPQAVIERGWLAGKVSKERVAQMVAAAKKPQERMEAQDIAKILQGTRPITLDGCQAAVKAAQDAFDKASDADRPAKQTALAEAKAALETVKKLEAKGDF